MQFVRSIFIRCSPGEAFGFLRDKHLSRQKPGSPVLLLEKTSPGPVGVGTTFREVVQMFPFIRGEILSTVTHCEPPGLLAEDFCGAGMRGWLVYKFIPERGGTRLVQSEELQYPGLMRLLTPLLMRLLLPRIEQRLEAIRMELENRWHGDDPHYNQANQENDPPVYEPGIGCGRYKVMIVYKEKAPPAEQYLRLFETTGWNQAYLVDAAQLDQALKCSYHMVAAWDGDKLVGFGRVVSDGVLYAMIYDMIVTPDYQGHGIGTSILERLVNKCRADGIREIQLFSARGKASFYRKRGFVERPPDGPGMRWVGEV